MLEWLSSNWDVILGFVLGIGIVSLYVNKLRTLLRQVAELFIAFDNALSDSSISKEEVVLLKKEFQDVWDAVKAFISKSPAKK